MFSAAKTSGPSGYNLTNSLRFRSSASAYLSRTPSVSSNRRTWTWSAWVKRGSLGAYQVLFGAGLNNGVNADELVSIYFTNSDQLGHYVNETGVADRNNYSTAVYRDPSAWYHIVAIYDSTQATAANRQRLFVNNVEITSWAATSYVSQNYQPSVNSNAYPHAIGKYGFNATRYFDGYMAEVNFIDGQALTPSSFGSTNATTGVWQPAKYTGTYGTNGFYLPFSDIATTSGSNAGLGKDFSGNSNYWTTNNISVTAGTTYDAMTDSPTLTSATVANYAVLNPVIYSPSTTYSRANLSFTASNTNWTQAVGTIVIPSTGKWYWEVVVGSSIGAGQMHGITATSSTLYSAGSTNWVGWNPLGYAYFNDGTKYNNNAGVAYGNSYTANDIIGIAFDADNGKLFFSKNGTWQASGDPVAGTNAAFTGLTGNSFYPAFSLSTNTGASTADINFGQRPFTYTPPTGFNRLNTFNLPNSTIVKGSDYFGATLYTGTTTGTGQTQTISHGQSFTPNLVWIKNRSAAHSHQLYDVIRGYGSNKNLKSNSSDEEGLYGDTNGYVSAVSSSQITTVSGSNATAYGEFVNQNTRTYVGWLWAANGAGVTNTSGSITSTVSVNTTAGFSIVEFTGTGANATVGHGLGVAPKMIILKRRNFATGWFVYHSSLPNTQFLRLQGTDAATTGTGVWNSTSPTSTVFSLGNDGNVNASGQNYINYCWAEIAGFSRFGSYTGNGSADGPFVYTGFRPKYVMIKGNAVVNWWILDTSRNTYNVANEGLLANSSAATNATINPVDFVSNGFKLRDSNGEINANGTTYVYACFAENPFKNALAR